MKNVLVHFDVRDDYLRLDTFVRSGQSAERAVIALNKIYFSDKVQFELVILAPERGSLKQYIGVVAKGVSGVSLALLALVQFMDSPSVQEISRELYGKTPTEEVIGRIRELKTRRERGEIDEEAAENEGKEIIEGLVARSAASSLQKPRESLDAINLSESDRYELQLAQSELYGAALDNPSVRGIGFTEEHEFPVPRNQFAERAIRPVKPEDETPKEEWRVRTERIRITSPNFDREDQETRKWKGKLPSDRSILFEIFDEKFWSQLLSGDVEFSEHTELVAQLATLHVNDRPKKNVVVRVLTVDGIRHAEALSDDALEAILGQVSQMQEADIGPNLLDFLD